MAGLFLVAGAEAMGAKNFDVLFRQACGTKFFHQHFVERPRSLPPTTHAAADKYLVPGESLDGTVQHVFQYRLAMQHVLGKYLVYQLPIDPLVLNRHLAGDHHADERLSTASAGATGLVQEDVVASGGGDVFAELVQDVPAAGGVFAGGRTDLDAYFVAGGPLSEDFFRPFGQRFVLLDNLRGHGCPPISFSSRRNGGARFFWPTFRRPLNTPAISPETAPCVKPTIGRLDDGVAVKLSPPQPPAISRGGGSLR